MNDKKQFLTVLVLALTVFFHSAAESTGKASKPRQSERSFKPKNGGQGYESLLYEPSAKAKGKLPLLIFLESDKAYRVAPLTDRSENASA